MRALPDRAGGGKTSGRRSRRRTMMPILRKLVLPLAAIVLAGAIAVPARAENWPQWRGPKQNGSSGAKRLPDKLDKEAAAWQVTLPGPGAGTPIVWENRIFLSALDQQSKKLLALCLDRKNGNVLWRKEVGLGFASNNRNNMASPSPLTDGKTVWFYYGTGDLAAFDFDGKQLWARNLQNDLGPFPYQWVYRSSPLHYEDRKSVV